jgi:hypothetical protein
MRGGDDAHVLVPYGCVSNWGKLPFDKLRANETTCPFARSLSKGKFRANETTCPFARSLSKGKFAPKLENAPPYAVICCQLSTML